MLLAWRSKSVNRRIFADTALVGAFLAAVKLAGAFKVVLIARTFGAGNELDAFLAAFLLPTFFADIIAGSLPAALIPTLIEVREGGGEGAMRRTQSSIAAAALLILAGAGLVMALVSPWLIRLVASGFDSGKRALAKELFYWLIPLVPLGGLSVVWRATLNAHERFAASSLAPVMTPLLAIALMTAAGPGAGIHLLVEASLLGMVLELAVLGGAVKRIGGELWPRWSGWEPAIRQVTRQYVPLIGVSAIATGNLLIDQSMAAMLGSGSVSALNYGTRLSAVLAGVGGTALSTAVLPHYSRMIAARDWTGVRRTLRIYGALVLAVSIPVTVLLVLASGPLVRVLFQRGAFGESAAGLVAEIQRLSLLQLPLTILLAMLLRVISSLNANAVLLRVALTNLVVNLAGDYVLMQFLGVPGIALSSAVVQLVSLVYILVLVKERVPAGGT